MKYYSEVEAEKFLKKNDFNVAKGIFCSSKNKIENSIRKVGVPFVMKVSGKNIVHKNQLGGIKVGIKTYSNALKEFSNLKKIKGSKGVLFQEFVEGKEFYVGIKKTNEFGHVVGFGDGGIDVEDKKDVSFRVTPLTKEDAKDLIKDTLVSKGLLKPDGFAIEEVILKISELVEENPSISELDINPLIVKDGKATVVDARIKFD
jgi:acetate---CoA ligase (ADP-forming)